MKSDSFKDKVIIVTGASSGIGLASARLFGACGARVVMAARRYETLLELAPSVASGPDRVLCVKADVSVEEDCRRLVEMTVEKFGGVDVLVNNAGLSMRAMFGASDIQVLRKLMDVNFWGTVHCTRYALPWLLKSKGSVVGVISVAGYSALPARSGYSASKFAVRGFLDTLRMEHLHDGLHVLVFAPGYTSSNIRNAALDACGRPQGETPLDESRLMSAEKCAEHLAVALLKRRDAVTLTALGRVTVWARNRFPHLADRLTCRYIARGKTARSYREECRPRPDTLALS